MLCTEHKLWVWGCAAPEAWGCVRTAFGETIAPSYFLTAR